MIKYFNKWGWFNDRLRGELNDKALKGKYAASLMLFEVSDILIFM